MPETSIAWGDLRVFSFSDGTNLYGREFQVLPSGTMSGVRQLLAGVIGFTASSAGRDKWHVATDHPVMICGVRGTDPRQLEPYYDELEDGFLAKQAGAAG